MLMLSRKKNESFVIELGNEVIKIMVTRIGAGVELEKREVQLGVDAPRGYRIWRTEIYEAIEENKRAAMATQYNGPKRLRDFFGK